MNTEKRTRIGKYMETVKKRITTGGLLAVLAACITSMPIQAAEAAEEVGKSVRIKNQVVASMGNRQLAPQDAVFISERISAALNSHGEIRLNDNSKVLVGENSVVSLDDFVVGSRGFESGTFNVAKGAFRLVTGNSKKNAMTVKTPLATIGARGTIFDVYVGAGGVTRVVLFSGAVEVCSSNNCILTDDRCDIVEVLPGTARELPFLRSGNHAAENAEYPLIDRQTRFQTGWRAPSAGCYARALFENTPKPSVPDGPGTDRGNRPGFGNRPSFSHGDDDGYCYYC